MAIGIIDGLELVEIDENAGAKLAGTRGLVYGLLDTVAQQFAVGQAGKAVMRGAFVL